MWHHNFDPSLFTEVCFVSIALLDFAKEQLSGCFPLSISVKKKSQSTKSEYFGVMMCMVCIYEVRFVHQAAFKFIVNYSLTILYKALLKGYLNV